MMRSISVYILLCLIIAANVVCTSNPTVAGGGDGSETTNGLAMTVKFPDGQTPAANAVVRIRPAGYLAFGDTVAGTIIDTSTGVDGSLRLDGIAAGAHTIEVIGDSSLGLVINVRFGENGSREELGAVGLKRTGRIYGAVNASAIAAASARIGIYGLQRTIATSADGRFFAADLPPSTYVLHAATLDPSDGAAGSTWLPPTKSCPARITMRLTWSPISLRTGSLISATA